MFSSKKKLCIVGTGGFATDVLCCWADIVASSNLPLESTACFMVKDTPPHGATLLGVELIGQSDFDPTLYEVIVAIGDCAIRKKVVSELPTNTTYATLVHPSAVVSKWVTLGAGTVVTAGSILTANIRIGNHAHLNPNTTIGHDCVIDDFFTAAPGANIGGNCTVGECVYFGANSASRQGTTIVAHTMIGMGAVVVKDILESGVYAGNPAKKLPNKK